MPNSIVKPSFAGGEVSPSMYARLDVSKQQIGLKTCRNCIVMPQGGIKNRPGTKFITEVKDSSETVRLIPFQFSTEQAYVLEFGELYIRVIKDGVLIATDLVDPAYKWTLSGSGTDEYHLELAGGGDPGIAAPIHMTENGITALEGTVGSLAPGEWDHGDNDALGYSTPYFRVLDGTDPDTKAQGYIAIPVYITTPYANEDLVDLKYAQSADTMYLTHPDHGIRKLARTSHTDWTLDGVPIIDGPYSGAKEEDLDNIFTSNSHFDLGFDLTVNSRLPMVGAEVGKTLRLGWENPINPEELFWGYGEITQVVDPTTLRVDPATVFGFNLIENFEFDYGLDFWEDRADAPSTVTHDLASQYAVITKSGGFDVEFNQAIQVVDREQYLLRVSIADSTAGIKIQVGTAQGLFDLLDVNAPIGLSIADYEITAESDTIWLRFWTGSHGAGVTKVGSAHLLRKNLNTPHWRISAHNPGTGFPQNVGFFEQRLVLGPSSSEPDTLWLSKTGDFENFSFNTPILANDSFSLSINAKEVNNIKWFTSLGTLVVGTTGEEWRISGESGALTPNSINSRPQSQNGSLPIQPVIVDNAILFAPRGGSAIKALSYSFDADGYSSSDLTILADHLFRNEQISEWAYSRYPDSVLWVINTNTDQLLGLSYLKEHDIFAWHRHDSVGGTFESITSITEPNSDDVYLVVSRTVNGAQKKYIEKLMPRITDEEVYDYFFVDSGLSYNTPLTITGATKADPVVITSTAHDLSNGDAVRISKVGGMTELNGNLYEVANVAANTFELKNYETSVDINGTDFGAYVSGGEVRKAITSFPGLSHLEGETVSVLADGSVIENKVVSSGTITLDLPAGLVHIGLPITTDIETLDLELATSKGSSIGKTKNIPYASMYFEKTQTANVGTDFDNLVELVFTDEGDSDDPTPLFTGQIREQLFSSSERQKTFVLRHTSPTPLTLLAVIPEADIRDK